MNFTKILKTDYQYLIPFIHIKQSNLNKKISKPAKTFNKIFSKESF